jgi:predicted aldo/keto reductase-like oxidoreductase
MRFRTDKKSGHRLSILGFGCMRFPKNFGSIDLRKTENLVIGALEGGVNYFDTAYMYPGSEEALGVILRKNRAREKIHIATKLPLVFVRGPEDFDKFFDRQLERLGTPYVDYYLMHMLTDRGFWEKLRSWGIEDWIEKKKKAGQILEAGFSFHGDKDEFLKLLEVYNWDFSQIQYNYSDENYQAGVTGLRKAAEKMSVMIMEPLLGGKLAVGLPREVVEIFKREAPERSPAAWGLNWVWDQEEVTLLLSGMEDQRQLEENLALADKAQAGMIGSEERETYRRVLEIFNNAYKIRCTGCGYCMPCPRNVNIPGCFAAYNTSFSMGYILGMQQYTTSTGITSERRSGCGLCVKCGTCESRCPQHIPIIKSLEMVRKRMEPFWYRAGIALFRAFLRKDKTSKRANQIN